MINDSPLASQIEPKHLYIVTAIGAQVPATGGMLFFADDSSPILHEWHLTFLLFPSAVRGVPRTCLQLQVDSPAFRLKSQQTPAKRLIQQQQLADAKTTRLLCNSIGQA
jgi:hypothetical protein